ncbi:GumC family protein [Robbsia andropogonis]|uniref:GumC family protein n=1 Tax=Robbsia andropogonis TaxID=28092 RepID=UPI0012F8BEE5|nr:hypothetical protein [Robbsia andropogonis]
MAITTRTRPDRKAADVEVSIRDYFNTFFYYRKIAATVFMGIVTIGVIVALAVPMPYRAQATLLVLLAGYYDQSNSPNGNVPIQPAVGQLNSVEAQILGSPELHRDVIVAKLGPSATEAEINKQLQHFESRFHIEQNDLANTIKLSYSDADPNVAANTLSRLLDQYFKRRAAIFTSGRVGLLNEQRDQAGNALKNANADLLTFQKKYGIVNIDDQITRAVQLESNLVSRKLDNDSKLAQDRAELKSLLATSQNVKETIPIFTDDTEASRAMATMQVSLMQLETRRADLASRYMSTSPFVAQLDQQIADTRASMAKQKSQLPNSTRFGHNTYYDTVQARLSALSSSIAGETALGQELQEQIKGARARLQQLSDVSSQIRQLQANRDILSDSYKDRARQAEMAAAQQGQVSQVNSTNVRVVQAPFPPSQRSVSRGLIIGASILAGLALSALAVLIAASLRETFLSPEQVERALALPVLNAQVQVGRNGAADRHDTTFRPLLKAYGRMIAAINGSTDNPTKIIMALSFGPTDGLLSVIRGLAIELEPRSTKPILILDLASSAEAPLYGKPSAQGLLTWAESDLQGNTPLHQNSPDEAYVPPANVDSNGMAIAQVDRHNIVVARPNDGDFPSSWEKTRALFDSLRHTYDYIIVHAPPANQSFSGIENASLADASVLVLRAEYTRKPVILSLKEQIQDSGGRLIGVALTHRRGYIPNFVYRFF